MLVGSNATPVSVCALLNTEGCVLVLEFGLYISLLVIFCMCLDVFVFEIAQILYINFFLENLQKKKMLNYRFKKE